ncbi:MULTISPECIES: hypothetical protein [unclassified Streptomyces]|uniref:Uncharacterized protein n=1 Tax=Streptomyces evansiae TaxID=3075535 RepID=A0ABU2R6F8_9ACTN|nr:MULTISPECIES: hypothetical protein [unclassified Streptomyces]MDT0411679.1 hypothetical protein [Streptomyces sp. DSM 41979]MYQ57902.1 hypothetical protein [Streptomyces sp. SID4926]MYR29091.1 hypothetical protein [Streptomyces sp. SID4945]SCD73937.1 hypothetical protein GA0115251_121520 [Streptomyces sp. TverLS-915]SCF43730.1 hypothetical protein GA0115257_1165127 [Streptomyces sp. LcepLS]
MPPNSTRHAPACVSDAEDAVAELRAALAANGLRLPSLSLDLASVAREAPCPHVTLGGCSPELAAKLAAVLRRKAVGA